MSIESKIVRIEGTSIIFRTTPTVGIVALTGFIDDATIVGSDSFKKTFRYTTNGVIYSDWQDLTLDNITAITLVDKNVFVAEINYTKIPPDSTINVTELSIATTLGTAEIAGFYFAHSLFNTYFQITDVDSLNWYINVLEKIYSKGLIPNYIDRLDDFDSPEDFLALWGAIARFFSFYVELARVFSKFYDNYKLISEFLTQRGLIVSPENTLEELQEMLKTFYFQMGERGTAEVMDDEVLRLIHSKTFIDEYIWCLFRKQHFGWNLGNSSPLYRGLRINDSLNKIPWSPKYVSVENSTNYNGGIVTNDGGLRVISLTNGEFLAFTVGGGPGGGDQSIRIDPKLDYQISFKVKLISGTFNFEAIGYQSDLSIVSLKSKKDNSDISAFFTEAVLSRNDKYITVKCYLYNKDSGISALNSTNIKQGQNLRMASTMVKLGLAWSASDEALFYDFRLVPMITTYSRGFLQSNNWIATWMLNRNGQYSKFELKDYISKYLIPYNCHLETTLLDSYSLEVIDPPTDEFEWRGAGEYCRTTIWAGDDQSCELKGLIWVADEDTAYCEQS